MNKKALCLLATALIFGITSCDTDTTDSTTNTSNTTEVGLSATRIEIEPIEDLLVVGDSINLQEIVTIYNSDNTTSHTAFTAEARSNNVEIAEDGYTVNIKAAGDITVRIVSTLTASVTGNLRTTAYEQANIALYNLFNGETGLTNYTWYEGQLSSTGAFQYTGITYNAKDKYVITPSLNNNYEWIGYEIYTKSLSDGKSYSGTADLNFSNITYNSQISWNRYIFGTAPADVSLLFKNSTIEYVVDGETFEYEGMLLDPTTSADFLRYTSYIGYKANFEFYLEFLGLDTDGTGAFFRGWLLVIEGDEKYGWEVGDLMPAGDYYMGDIGTTSVAQVDATLTNPDYVPEPIDYTEIKAFTDKAAEAKNYRVTASTTIYESDGTTPVTDQDSLFTWNNSARFFNDKETVYMNETSFYDEYIKTENNYDSQGETKDISGATVHNGAIYLFSDSSEPSKYDTTSNDIWDASLGADTVTSDGLVLLSPFYFINQITEKTYAEDTIFESFDEERNTYSASGKLGYSLLRLAPQVSWPLIAIWSLGDIPLAEYSSVTILLSDSSISVMMANYGSSFPECEDIANQVAITIVTIDQIGTAQMPDISDYLEGIDQAQ